MTQLVKLGTLHHELRLPSGKCPDIFFEGADELSFHADVTSVSDTGVDRRNPFQEFMDLIETAKRSLGLGVGGVYLNVLERNEITTKGRRRKLRLPPYKDLAQHVQDVIVPEMKRQLALSQWPLEMKFDNDTVGYGLQITDGPYSGGSFGAYDIPTVEEQNPLFYALKKKATQLRGAPSLSGIIVGDGDCASMDANPSSWSGVPTSKIVETFLQKHDWIDFVMLITVTNTRSGWPFRDEQLSLKDQIWTRRGAPPDLRNTLIAVREGMPVPVNTAVNAAHRAKEEGYGHGHEIEMTSSLKLKIGARQIMEVLAGLRSVDHLNRDCGWRRSGEPPVSDPHEGHRFPNPFEAALRQGRLPSNIQVTPTGPQGRDVILEIEFGEPDPAISPFH